MVDHLASFQALALLWAKLRNVWGGVPVIVSTIPLGREPWPLATVSVS